MDIPRRQFLSGAAWAAAGLTASCGKTAQRPQPNILWITCEDMWPSLGCYGDDNAKTPYLDAFAGQSVRYRHVFATAPVCTPSRSCIITGVYPPAMGSQHQREVAVKSDQVPLYPEYLRDAGYYCTNNAKTDYNFYIPENEPDGVPLKNYPIAVPPNVWDDCTNTAHWRKRPADQPFFSVFNIGLTHQWQTDYAGADLTEASRKLPPEIRHDPADMQLPPYYPDTPIVRENMAAYHTQITLMDIEFGKLLQQLEEDGFTDNTIVMFCSDHGAGLPKGKRWVHDSGIRIPFMARFPEKYSHWAPADPREWTDRLVSFVDVAPTLLSLAGKAAPGHMHGRAFLGDYSEPAAEYVFAMRDRVDDILECSRSVHDVRYQYIRNFYPYRPRMQYDWTTDLTTPIRQEIRRLHNAGQLQGAETWLTADNVPAEELYDIKNDPHTLHNLVDDPSHQARLERMREATYQQMLTIRDTSLIPEGEMHRRAGDRPPYEVFRNDAVFPVERILDAARLVGMGSEHRDPLISLLDDDESCVRYWAVVGLTILGEDARPAIAKLNGLLDDASGPVRVAAAECLCRLGRLETGAGRLLDVFGREDKFQHLEAAVAILLLGEQARPYATEIKTALAKVQLPEKGWQKDITEVLKECLRRLES